MLFFTVWLTVKGFLGGLGPFSAGAGWLCVFLHEVRMRAERAERKREEEKKRKKQTFTF